MNKYPRWFVMHRNYKNTGKHIYVCRACEKKCTIVSELVPLDCKRKENENKTP